MRNGSIRPTPPDVVVVVVVAVVADTADGIVLLLPPVAVPSAKVQLSPLQRGEGNAAELRRELLVAS